MSTISSTPVFASPTDIVECVGACLDAYGLEATMDYFTGMERLLSRLPWWAEVKAESDKLFAEERKRQEELVLARARAAAPNVYQVLPTAQAGVNISNQQYDNRTINMTGDNSNYNENNS